MGKVGVLSVQYSVFSLQSFVQYSGALLLCDVNISEDRTLNTEYLLQQHRKLRIGLILFLTLAAFGLRFFRLSNQSLWTDEVASILTAQVGLNRIVEESAFNNSMPTFFLLLRGILGGATENVEFRARALSAMAGALSVPVFVGVVYFWRKNWRGALLGGLLLALNPLDLWYSQEVRAYTLMLLFGLLTLICYELARLRRSTLWWSGYILCALLAVALHKTALVFPVACALWHGRDALRMRRDARILLVHPAVLAIALTVLMPRAYPPPPEFSRSGSLLEIGYTFMTYVGGYSFGPSLTDIQSQGAFAAVARHPFQTSLLCAAIFFFGIACLVVHWWPPGERAPASALATAAPEPPSTRMPAFPGKELSLIVVAVIAAAAGALLSRFPYNIRYTLPGLLGFLALATTLCANTARPAFRFVAISGLLITSVWADWQWFFSPAYRKGDSRAVAQWLVENRERVKSWTALPDYLSISLNWYLKPHPEVLVQLQPAAKANTTTFPPVPDVLIMGRRHHVLEPDRLIAEYQKASGGARLINSFAGFELYVRDSTR